MAAAFVNRAPRFSTSMSPTSTLLMAARSTRAPRRSKRLPICPMATGAPQYVIAGAIRGRSRLGAADPSALIEKRSESGGGFGRAQAFGEQRAFLAHAGGERVAIAHQTFGETQGFRRPGRERFGGGPRTRL